MLKNQNMQIDYDILITYGGVARKFAKGDFIFYEDTLPYYYYQLVSGEVRMFSTNAEGKELIQGVFVAGQSFGEPPLLLGKVYPSTAQAITDGVLVKIRKEHFLSILTDYPEFLSRIMYTFAKRIYSKATAVQVWVQQTPEEKIKQFLCNSKVALGDCVNQPLPYTRQQIADFTGLRVETVIRTLTRMNKDGKVKIINHKLYY